MITNLEYLFDNIIRINFKKNQQIKFIGTDTEERFLQNSKNEPNWIWCNQEISYNYNSWGYRCPEFDLSGDYALAFGCSHTEGMGLKEEQTWPQVLSDKLGYPVYNLGVGGASNQFTYYNNILWIKNYKKLSENARPPRRVYCQWTQVTRSGEIDSRNLYQTSGPNYPSLQPIWSKTLEENVTNFELQTWYYYQTVKLLWQALGIEQIHFHLETVYLNQDYKYLLRDCDWHWLNDQNYYIALDKARDLMHFGPRSMCRIVDQLEEIRLGTGSWIHRSE